MSRAEVAPRAGTERTLGARLFDRSLGASLTATPQAGRRTLAVLAGVLVLDWADRNVLGGMAPELRRDLGISNSELGMLSAAFSIVGAVASLPVGILVDRTRRLVLLSGAVGLWSVAIAATGFAENFAMLMGARLLLGAIAATAGPTTPSVVGDLVCEQDRGRVMGFVDGGQMVGTGVGYLLSAFVLAFLSWRWGFWLLAVPGVVLALVLRRLPEPVRTAHADRSEQPVERNGTTVAATATATAADAWRAARVILGIRTNVIVLLATSVGNLFFAAVSTFAVVFTTEQYGISTSQADLGVIVIAVGAVAGILLGGRLGDRLMRQQLANGRLWVAAVGLLLAAALGTPVLFLHSLLVAAVLIAAGTAALNAAVPVLDAVRLDVVPPDLRGRAEGIRTVLRAAAEGLAPLAIGILADHLAGGGHDGLRWALLLVMPALALNGLLLLLAMRTYPAEAAAASRASHSVDRVGAPR